jgi:predicted ester cyclase/catechol 2,3-dioxygenase-like lactoylglutathione lyase family enzyme
MPHTIARLSLAVRDYDEAIAFFTGALRFVVLEDEPRGSGKRWVVVAPPGPGVALVLAKAVTAEQRARIGETGGRVLLFLHTDDFAAEHAHMLAAGVRFVEQPRHEPHGKVAIFLDLYGNRWELIEPAQKTEPVADAADTREHGKGLVRAMVAAINAQDWAALEIVVAPDFVRHSDAAGEPAVRSRAQLVAFLKSELMTFPDAEESLLDLVAQGDRVAVRHSFTGTQHGTLGMHAPSGRRMTATYLAIYRIAGGRIVEAWVEWDAAAGLRQLGHRAP